MNIFVKLAIAALSLSTEQISAQDVPSLLEDAVQSARLLSHQNYEEFPQMIHPELVHSQENFFGASDSHLALQAIQITGDGAKLLELQKKV